MVPLTEWSGVHGWRRRQCKQRGRPPVRRRAPASCPGSGGRELLGLSHRSQITVAAPPVAVPKFVGHSGHCTKAGCVVRAPAQRSAPACRLRRLDARRDLLRLWGGCSGGAGTAAARCPTEPIRKGSPGGVLLQSTYRSRGTGGMDYYGGLNCAENVQNPRLRSCAVAIGNRHRSLFSMIT